MHISKIECEKLLPRRGRPPTAPTYIGTPCKKCGSTLRYCCKQECIVCRRERKRKWMEKNAFKASIYSIFDATQIATIQKLANDYNVTVKEQIRTLVEWGLESYKDNAEVKK